MKYQPIKIVDDKSRTCCFSGHRSGKLVGKGDTVNSMGLRRILSVLMLSIREAVDEGYDTFLTGMAEGIDMWAARFVLELKTRGEAVKLICVIPFRGQQNSYGPQDKFDYNTILDKADKVVYLSESFTKDCFKNRNECMVDNSSKLIAVVSNYTSGTGQTIRMAQAKGLDTRVIDVKKNPAIFSDTDDQ